MNFADIRKKFSGGDRAASADPSRAFGSEAEMMQALRKQEFTPPKPRPTAAEVMGSIRQRFARPAEEMQDRIPRDEAAARTYAPEAMAQPEWENPFTAPEKPKKPARDVPVYETVGGDMPLSAAALRRIYRKATRRSRAMTPTAAMQRPIPRPGTSLTPRPIRRRAMQRPPTARRTTILMLLRRTIRGITPPIPRTHITRRSPSIHPTRRRVPPTRRRHPMPRRSRRCRAPRSRNMSPPFTEAAFPRRRAIPRRRTPQRRSALLRR